MSRYDDPSLLREPTRPMPESLRSRLLVIPGEMAAENGAQTEADELDRLYDAALAAQSKHDAESLLDEESLETTPLRAAIVRLLAAVFRDSRVVRPLPEQLAAGLRAVRTVSKTADRKLRSVWKTRWVTEPRWAAAACWLLAFALTLGTGESVAGLLDAPTQLHAKSSSWVQRAGDAWDGARTYVRDDLWSDLRTDTAKAARSRIKTSYGFVHARAEALGVQIEATADRLAHDAAAALSVVRGDLMPQIQPQAEESLTATPDRAPDTASDNNPTNPGDPSPEEARDDR